MTIEDLGGMEEMAANRLPTTALVALPPLGSDRMGEMRVIGGYDAEGGTWVRILWQKPGQLAVIDVPAEVDGRRPAEELAELIAEAGRQTRSGIVIP